MFGNVKTPVKILTPRDTLFGDMPLENWAQADSNELPWNLFKDAKLSIDKGNKKNAIEALNAIIEIPELESRHYLQAYFFLRKLNPLPVKEIKLYGVVVEVAIEGGVDMLAVYADHSARYYNYTGGAIIWDSGDMLIGDKIDNILLLGIDIIKQIGLWKDDRPMAPNQGFARVNFLTSHGLYFGEARQQDLFNDPLATRIMYAMLDMMETLTDMAIN